MIHDAVEEASWDVQRYLYQAIPKGETLDVTQIKVSRRSWSLAINVTLKVQVIDTCKHHGHHRPRNSLMIMAVSDARYSDHS